jgi:TolB-like protein/Flp pilus assembly protein TadD
VIPAPLVFVLAILPSGHLASWQCPDGAPPPCRAADARTRAAPPASVAVLDPVAPASDTAASELADGLAEDLAIRLGEVSRLTVRSRATVRRLREASAMSMEQLGRALSASYLVSLSVRRSGTTLRFSAELTRAANGSQVWAAQYDRADQNLLAMQSEIARAVAGGVAGRLFPSEQATLTARPTASSEAYGAYLRGLALRKAVGNDAGGLAQQQRAVAIDSGFAAAWSELAIEHAAMYWFYFDRSEARLALARAAAERGLRLAPNAAVSHVAMAYVHYWGSRDYEAALAQLRIALSISPNESDVHDAMANVLRRQGQWDASLASRRRAVELSPSDALPISELGLTLLMLRRFAEADSAYDRAAALGLESVNSQINRVLSPLEQGQSVARVQSGVTLFAAHLDDALMQIFKDPQLVLPLLRLVPELQDAIVRSIPGARLESRAGRALAAGQVLEVRGDRDAAARSYDSARVMIEELVRQRPDDAGLRASLALALAGSGRGAEAVREGEAAVRLLPVSLDAVAGPQLVITLAQVLIRTGDAERAITLLEDMLARPTVISRTLLRTDPAYAALRGNARFERLVN